MLCDFFLWRCGWTFFSHLRECTQDRLKKLFQGLVFWASEFTWIAYPEGQLYQQKNWWQLMICHLASAELRVKLHWSLFFPRLFTIYISSWGEVVTLLKFDEPSKSVNLNFKFQFGGSNCKHQITSYLLCFWKDLFIAFVSSFLLLAYFQYSSLLYHILIFYSVNILYYVHYAYTFIYYWWTSGLFYIVWAFMYNI